MFEALASKEPFHLGFQAAVVISPSYLKQPTYCREVSPLLQRSGTGGMGGGRLSVYTLRGIHFPGNWEENPSMSGARCWWKNVATQDVCQAVTGPPLCGQHLMRGLGHWEPCSSPEQRDDGRAF